jgi:hypothetical protein
MIKHFAHFSSYTYYVGDEEETSGAKIKEWHSLLELADCDLDDFFAEYDPPLLQTEIESLWKSIFGLADAVASIHELRVSAPLQENKLCAPKKFQLYYGFVLEQFS